MQHKLKEALQSRARRKSQSIEDTSQYSEPNNAQAEHSSIFSRDQNQAYSNASERESYQSSQSQLLSSAQNLGHVSNAHASQPVDHTYFKRPESASESMETNYSSNHPVLSPIGGSHNDRHSTIGDHRELPVRNSTRRHEEDVADRNIHRYSGSIDAGPRNATSAIPGKWPLKTVNNVPCT